MADSTSRAASSVGSQGVCSLGLSFCSLSLGTGRPANPHHVRSTLLTKWHSHSKSLATMLFSPLFPKSPEHGSRQHGSSGQLSPNQDPEPYSERVIGDLRHVRYGGSEHGIRNVHAVAAPQTVALRPVRVFLRIPESRMLPALNRSRTLALAVWWLRDRATSISSHVAPFDLSPRMM